MTVVMFHNKFKNKIKLHIKYKLPNLYVNNTFYMIKLQVCKVLSSFTVLSYRFFRTKINVYIKLRNLGILGKKKYIKT